MNKVVHALCLGPSVEGEVVREWIRIVLFIHIWVIINGVRIRNHLCRDHDEGPNTFCDLKEIRRILMGKDSDHECRATRFAQIPSRETMVNAEARKYDRIRFPTLAFLLSASLLKNGLFVIFQLIIQFSKNRRIFSDIFFNYNHF